MLKLFSAPDLIGDPVKALPPRSTCFPSQSNLVLNSRDIPSVELVDQRTRDALQKSVQLALEVRWSLSSPRSLTPLMDFECCKHDASGREQEAKGLVERKRMKGQADAAEVRKKLLVLQALSAAVQSTGHVKAEAESRAEAARIEGKTAVEQSTGKSIENDDTLRDCFFP